MTTSPRTQAALNIPVSVVEIVKFGQFVIASMTNNVHFPNPSPSLSTVTSDLNALEAAEVLVANRTKGAAANRDLRLEAVIADLHALKFGVQVIADANPASAAAIIQSAGMAVKVVVPRQRQAASVKQGPVSGSVRLTAQVAGRNVCYEWQWSVDGKTWTNAPSTMVSRTTVSGLTVGTNYEFRYRTVTRAGEGDYSQPISFLVK
jgi:hypothetical protein